MVTKLVMFILVKSVRETNFDLYCQSLSELLPFFFAKKKKCARLLPIHLRDMVTLKEKHPELDEKLEKENFVVQKTTRVFSALPIYQAYEQVNAVIKANGNIISITEDPPALRR